MSAAIRSQRINRGESYIGDVPSAAIGELRERGRLEATDRLSPTARLRRDRDHLRADAAQRHPRPRYLLYRARRRRYRPHAAHRPAGDSGKHHLPRHDRGGSQAAPGSDRPAVGEDCFLAFSPERIDPGQTNSKGYTVENTPKVVGGVTPACTELAARSTASITSQVVPVSSPRVAELTKLFENIFRSVNIALVNELALLCDRMGLNVWEVIDAAATKPFGFMKFTPGPGLGGHCIPVDPFYLTWKAREFDLTTRFIELAGEVNTQMPRHVHDLVARALNRQRKALNGARMRAAGRGLQAECGRLPRVAGLQGHGAAGGRWRRGRDGRSACRPTSRIITASATTPRRSPTNCWNGADCAVIITDHSAFDYERIVARAQVVVDTRNATRAVQEGREKITLL